MADKTNTKSAASTTTRKKTTKPAAKSKPESTASTTNVDKKPAKRQFKPGDLIPCKSVAYGVLMYDTKRGPVYEWSGFGDVCEIDYADLLSMKVGKSRFFKEPWIIILDEELASQWGMTEMNKIFDNIGDVESLLNGKLSELKKTLNNAPAGYKNLIAKTASRMLRDGELDKISTVRTIDDMLGTNLSMMLSVSGGNL